MEILRQCKSGHVTQWLKIHPLFPVISHWPEDEVQTPSKIFKDPSYLSCCLILQPRLSPYVLHPAGWDFELDLKRAGALLYFGALLRVGPQPGTPFPLSLPAPLLDSAVIIANFFHLFYPVRTLPPAAPRALWAFSVTPGAMPYFLICCPH